MLRVIKGTKELDGDGTPTSLSKTDHSNVEERYVPLRLWDLGVQQCQEPVSEWLGDQYDCYWKKKGFKSTSLYSFMANVF